MLRANALLLAQLVVQLEVGSTQAASTVPSAQDVGERTLVVSAGDRLTVRAARARLQELVHEIARQTQIRIIADTEFDERVSMTLTDLPVETALRRLVADHHFVFIYAAAGKLEEVRVYRILPAGQHPVTASSVVDSASGVGLPRQPPVGDGDALGRESSASLPGPPAGPVEPATTHENPRERTQDTLPQRPGQGSPGPINPLGSGVGVTVSGPIANPKIAGPIPATTPGDGPLHDHPLLASQLDLAALGYVEEEYFLEGTANRYRTPPLATGVIMSSGHPYRTRMIVRRPRSGAEFNGTVLVEWLDTTNGFDLDAVWMASHKHILRSGYAYVGVSAQRVGVHGANIGLKSWSPVRYSTLDVTAGGAILDDSLSYDIFSQAVQAIRHPVGVEPLGELPVGRVFAVGAQQPHDHFVTYHNSIQPLAVGFDAFLFFGIDSQLRTDLDVKVFSIKTETDVLRQPTAPGRLE